MKREQQTYLKKQMAQIYFKTQGFDPKNYPSEVRAARKIIDKFERERRRNNEKRWTKFKKLKERAMREIMFGENVDKVFNILEQMKKVAK